MFDRMMDFFYSAMSGSQSYAGGGKATPIPDMPGWKGFEVTEGRYRLQDRYTSVSVDVFGAVSLGQTVLWSGEKTQFFMAYQGCYPKEVVPFLKETLLDTYKKKIFHGGRGIMSVYNGHDVYSNCVEWFDKTQNNFRGTEQILDFKTEKRVGYHHYWGMFLEQIPENYIK